MFEDVPSSFGGTSSSSSESVGLCFFPFGKSRRLLHFGCVFLSMQSLWTFFSLWRP